jgi:hypothetical protein
LASFSLASVGSRFSAIFSSLLGVPLPAYSGQNAQFAQDQHIHICKQLVPHQAGIPIIPIRSRPVSFDRKYQVFSCSSRPAFSTVIKSFLES